MRLKPDALCRGVVLCDRFHQLFKVSRDEELEFVDANTPDVLDPNKEDENAVVKFAKMSSKALLQVAKTL